MLELLLQDTCIFAHRLSCLLHRAVGLGLIAGDVLRDNFATVKSGERVADRDNGRFAIRFQDDVASLSS